MSCIYFLKYLDPTDSWKYVRILQGEMEIIQLVDRVREATPFISEPEAWHAANKFNLDITRCEVCR